MGKQSIHTDREGQPQKEELVELAMMEIQSTRNDYSYTTCNIRQSRIIIGKQGNQHYQPSLKQPGERIIAPRYIFKDNQIAPLTKQYKHLQKQRFIAYEQIKLLFRSARFDITLISNSLENDLGHLEIYLRTTKLLPLQTRMSICRNKGSYPANK